MYQQSNPVLRPHQPFNPAEDATRLYKAMKGFGTDEVTLIDVLCRRTYPQRQEIAAVFKQSYGKDLLKEVASETSGNFRHVLRGLILPPMQFEAEEARESIQGLGTNEAALIDIVCTKSNQEIIALRDAYRVMYHRNLEQDVKSDVSGYFERLLVSLMAGHRLNDYPNQQKAVQLAKVCV
jgi:annexin A7/11